jgi:hypothetical protein
MSCLSVPVSSHQSRHITNTDRQTACTAEQHTMNNLGIPSTILSQCLRLNLPPYVFHLHRLPARDLKALAVQSEYTLAFSQHRCIALVDFSLSFELDFSLGLVEPDLFERHLLVEDVLDHGHDGCVGLVLDFGRDSLSQIAIRFLTCGEFAAETRDLRVFIAVVDPVVVVVSWVSVAVGDTAIRIAVPVVVIVGAVCLR